LASAVIAYNVYDNNRIIVKEQVVYIDNLPLEFDGFRILQLSDLHGRRFGDSQSELAAKVNGMDYDMIAFTGDMEPKSTEDFTSFIELLDGIENKSYMFYVNGNDDIAYSTLTGKESDIGRDLTENGCILLTEPYPIKRADKTLWISNYFTKSLSDEHMYDPAYRAYKSGLARVFSEINSTGGIKIGITHVPFTESDFAKIDKDDVLDYSLILAGHYHGGQFRIPFYGALYIPADQNDGGGFFPDQRYVSGLVNFGGIQQYVSGGLGASNIPFRFFNTPEINLIILKTK
jgi:predicted MPP superfamily phosphohydrolase